MIYVGIYKQNQIRDYWHTEKNQSSYSLVYKSMSLNQFIYISDSGNKDSAYIKVKDLFKIFFC